MYFCLDILTSTAILKVTFQPSVDDKVLLYSGYFLLIGGLEKVEGGSGIVVENMGASPQAMVGDLKFS